MKLRWMTSAVVTLGISAAVPAMASDSPGYPGQVVAGAGQAVRVDHVEWHDREFRDRAEVPPRVIETAERVGNGRHIDSIVLVRREHEHHEFFVVHMSRYNKRDISVRIEPDGDLIAIDR